MRNNFDYKQKTFKRKVRTKKVLGCLSDLVMSFKFQKNVLRRLKKSDMTIKKLHALSSEPIVMFGISYYSVEE